jgi:hypothetical protein
LAGQPGQLLSLIFADGQRVQAFCPGSGYSQCLVRRRTPSDPPTAWQNGALQLLDTPPGASSDASVLITLQGTPQPQRLASFQLPMALLLQAITITAPPER